ncbi:hypothetical protein [Zymobacter sp. IVIA_12111.31 C1]|uniref:hypothetical protein n=1 Tax=Zymobacter sp. IVIA_12111.31 C1 TaxID=3394854 RepID=UPI0039C1646E
MLFYEHAMNFFSNGEIFRLANLFCEGFITAGRDVLYLIFDILKNIAAPLLTLVSTAFGIWFYLNKIKVELTYSFSTCIRGNRIPFLDNFSIKNKRDNTQNIYGIFCVVNGTAYNLKEWRVPVVLGPYGVLEVEFKEITTYLDKDGGNYPDLMREENKVFYINLGNKVIKLKDDKSIDFFSFSDKKADGTGCLIINKIYSVNETDTIVITERMDYNIGLMHNEKYIKAIVDKNGYILGDPPLDSILIPQYKYEESSSEIMAFLIRKQLGLEDTHEIDVIDIRAELNSRPKI